ncbi:MAG: hypothetical protein NWF09_08340 [Candidatus Bathyarchaeota archaeon]|nr:hypothetical protein [Candidatus Bathyarchaeota archaeon]
MFKCRRANTSIFEIPAKENSQTIKQLLKQVTRYPGLEETYYASLTKRLHALKEAGYIKETKTTRESAKIQTFYELKPKKPTSLCCSKKTACRTYLTKPQTYRQPQSCYHC